MRERERIGREGGSEGEEVETGARREGEGAGRGVREGRSETEGGQDKKR